MHRLTKTEILKEYSRCKSDTPYALKTYLTTFDNTQKKFVPVNLFPDQIKLINDYDNFEENIALKYRQAGVSTVTAAWASKKIIVAKKSRPEKILIIANKKDTAVEMASKVKNFLGQWPGWFGVGFDPIKNAASHYRMTNGCEVKAVATSKDALRGYTPTILIFDEAAYIDADSDFWSACMASLSTGGKVIVISTPNGYDPIYHSIYSQALNGMNDFKVTEMFWYRDPRYAKDLKLIKVDDIVEYMLNRANYTNVEEKLYEDIEPRERDYDEIQKLIKSGYKPYSTWFEKMSKKFKFDYRKISQELECAFHGSGDNVISSKIRDKIRENDLLEPISREMGNSLWVWKEPIKGHRYILGIDVSRGDSEDFTTFTIIDFDEREQVVEYTAKVKPDVVASIAYQWGIKYNAFIVIDITGGMGVSTANKLVEMRYPSLYYEGIDISNIWGKQTNIESKTPGINYQGKRVQIIASFEEALRYDFKVRSVRLLDELSTFVYINGRPDHMKGKHDDLIMAISMCIYVAENSFGKLEKADGKVKAMLDSWKRTETPYKEQSQFFNPHVSASSIYGNNVNRQTYNDMTKQAFMEHAWLFGGLYKK